MQTNPILATSRRLLKAAQLTVRSGCHKVGHTAAGSQSATEFAFLLLPTYRNRLHMQLNAVRFIYKKLKCRPG
jgi:hypothetical protein